MSEEIAHTAPVMKTFIGTKILRAMQMTRGDYNLHRGWTIPENEDPTEKGYLVIYSPDDYKSWSPAHVFEEAYVLIPDAKDGDERWQLRVKGEFAELNWRFKKLEVFLKINSGFPEHVLEDLANQRRAMKDLLDILRARIDKFA